MTEINNHYEKCRLLTNMFDSAKHAIGKNISMVLQRKQYNMRQI